MELTSLASNSLDLGRLAAELDGLTPEGRLAALASFDRRTQARLYEAAKGFRAIGLEDIVPASVGSRVTVIHEGRNTLPAFTRFQKRFLRPRDGARELWGYNHQTLAPITGLGYFVALPAPGGEVVIDYRELPPEAPPGWPARVPNSAGLSRFVYFNMEDFLRGISRHVTIGRATRKGKAMDAWFVLVRQDRD